MAKKAMDKKIIERYKQKLMDSLAEVAKLRARLDGEEHSVLTDLPKNPDDALPIERLAENIAAIEGLEMSELEQIRRALNKLEEGTYGTCERCGRSISRKRLAVLPYARYCVECQEEVEREEKMRSAEVSIPEFGEVSEEEPTEEE